MIKEEDINVIEDNDFLDKDVSELEEKDFYVFHIYQDLMYMYKDGCIAIVSLKEPEGRVTMVEYTKGTLREFINTRGIV
jgi:hypothetical protein